jgi:uncharacterized iron-regulated membrane protein
MQSSKQLLLRKRLWRWHFFAGVMVIPFAIILAVTGSIYLFKPQIEHYVEDHINQNSVHYKRSTANAMPAGELIDNLLNARPNATFSNYTLAKVNDPSVEIQVRENGITKVYWVDQYDSTILKEEVSSDRFLELIRSIHGELLSGSKGSYVVELMASWMIVLVITGLYLWWPTRQKGESRLVTFKAFFLPTLSGLSTREKYKRLHGAFGLWISVMVLVLLLTGLPWTQVWGDGFDRVQSTMGWTSSASAKARALKSQRPVNDGTSLWERSSTTDTQQAVTLKSSTNAGQIQDIGVTAIVTKATALSLEAPVVVYAPRGENGVWTVRSRTDNRSARTTVHYDRWSGEELMRVNFNDAHPVSQIVSYGIALHEGALFGVFNQILGLVTALGIITLSITGFIMWWARRPKGTVAAPKKPKHHTLPMTVVGITLVLAVFLPMVAMSLVVALLFDFVYQNIANSRQQKST